LELATLDEEQEGGTDADKRTTRAKPGKAKPKSTREE
jgi:hypothetical protein